LLFFYFFFFFFFFFFLVLFLVVFILIRRVIFVVVVSLRVYPPLPLGSTLTHILRFALSYLSPIPGKDPFLPSFLHTTRT